MGLDNEGNRKLEGEVKYRDKDVVRMWGGEINKVGG